MYVPHVFAAVNRDNGHVMVRSPSQIKCEKRLINNNLDSILYASSS